MSASHDSEKAASVSGSDPAAHHHQLNNADASSDYSVDEKKQYGVLLAEQAGQVAGKWLFVAWVGLALTAYVTGLDNNIQYAAQTAAAQQYASYGSYSNLAVVQQVLIAVGKFPIAKLADVFGRSYGYAVSLVFYVVGFIVMASSSSWSVMIGGTVLYAIGNTGTSIMQQIILADSTSTRHRALSIGLLSFPYIINFACAPLIVKQLNDTWRWIPGFFSIIVPVAVAPIISSLAVTQHRASRAGLIPRHPYRSMTWFQALATFFADMDIVGLVLIAAGWILILLPLNLAKLATKGWASPHIIAMLVVGGCCLIAVGIWESFFASKPILRRDMIFNRDIILCAAFIGAADFCAFYLSWLSVYVWVTLVRPDYTISDATYISNIQSVSLSVFGIAFGALAAITRRYKIYLVFGSLLRILAIGLAIRYRTTGASTAQIVMPQLLSGMGGGAMGVLLQLAAQVATRHQNVAMVTAFVLLITEVGGAIGSAVIGALQSNYLLDKLSQYILAAGGTATDVTNAFGSPTGSLTWTPTAPVAAAIRDAWHDYMRVALIVAIVVSVIPVVASLLINNRKLGGGQNCVSDEPVAGFSLKRSRTSDQDK